MSTDATRGPWFAIATDSDGYVLYPFGMPDWAEICAYIMVGRNTAEPVGIRMTEHANADDVLYEIDLTGEPEGRAETCWTQAQTVADALNVLARIRAWVGTYPPIPDDVTGDPETMIVASIRRILAGAESQVVTE